MDKAIIFVVLIALLQTSTALNVTDPVPIKTSAPTPVPTTPKEPVETPKAVSIVPPAQKTPPAASPPPPPPGAGSQKTAVLSVIVLSGNGLRTFNATLGDAFLAAMAETYGISSSSMVIRNWGKTGRRLLFDTLTVASAARFANGIAAESGLAALTAAADSGDLQESFQAAGLEVESLNLQSAVTALPSNFQAFTATQQTSGLRIWVIIVIAVVGILVVVSLVLCCCWRPLCCCHPREEDGKFGTLKEVNVSNFQTTQKFKPTPSSKPAPLPAMQCSVPKA